MATGWGLDGQTEQSRDCDLRSACRTSNSRAALTLFAGEMLLATGAAEPEISGVDSLGLIRSRRVHDWSPRREVQVAGSMTEWQVLEHTIDVGRSQHADLSDGSAAFRTLALQQVPFAGASA
jgi:hypothetical protein